MKKVLLTSIASISLFVMAIAKPIPTDLAADLAKDENFIKAANMFYNFTQKVKQSNSISLLQKISVKTATEAEVETFAKQIGMTNKRELLLMLAEYNRTWYKIYQHSPALQSAQDKNVIIKEALNVLESNKKNNFLLPPLNCFSVYMQVSSGCFTTASIWALTDEDAAGSFLGNCLFAASAAYLVCAIF